MTKYFSLIEEDGESEEKEEEEKDQESKVHQILQKVQIFDMC